MWLSTFHIKPISSGNPTFHSSYEFCLFFEIAYTIDPWDPNASQAHCRGFRRHRNDCEGKRSVLSRRRQALHIFPSASFLLTLAVPVFRHGHGCLSALLSWFLWPFCSRGSSSSQVNMSCLLHMAGSGPRCSGTRPWTPWHQLSLPWFWEPTSGSRATVRTASDRRTSKPRI